MYVQDYIYTLNTTIDDGSLNIWIKKLNMIDGPVLWTQPTSIRIEEGSSTISELSVYPNPSRDVFNITFTSESKQSIELRIINLVGEIIFTETLENFEGEYTKSFNLSEYSKVVYLLD